MLRSDPDKEMGILQGIFPIVVTTLFLTPPVTEGAVFMSSEVTGPDNLLCSGDRLVYTCSTSDGVLSWNVGETDLGSYVASLDDLGKTWTDTNLPGIEAVLTAEDGLVLTSTLTIPSAGSVVANESTISCSDFGGNVNRSVLRIVGSPSAPGISVTLGDIAHGSVNVQLTPPVYGRECISEYIVEYDEFSRPIGTSTSIVISNLDLCFQGHNFAAFGVTPGVPNGTRSISVNLGRVLLTVPNLVTVTADVSPRICPTAAVLRWNQPTEIQECIAGYTAETTTTSGSWNTFVTSTTATVNINSSECCLRYIFTVTPVYAQLGPRNTSDPVSLVPGQNSFPQPGNLKLNVIYGTTIRSDLFWENADTLSIFPAHHIMIDVDSREQYTLSGSGAAPTSYMIQPLEYGMYINHSVPISVSFSSGNCMSSSNLSATFPFIISGLPAVEAVGQHAVFTITFEMFRPPSVRLSVVDTAIVEVEVTAASGDAISPSRSTAMFPNTRSTQILITSLDPDTDYHYRVRVLTSDSSSAVEIPRAVEGNFTSGSESVSTGAIVAISVAVILVFFTVGVLPVVVIVYCCGAQKRKAHCKSRASPDEFGPAHAEVEPVYAQVQKRTDDVEVKMKRNVSYGPFLNPIDKIEMGENIAYGLAGH